MYLFYDSKRDTSTNLPSESMAVALCSSPASIDANEGFVQFTELSLELREKYRVWAKEHLPDTELPKEESQWDVV